MIAQSQSVADKSRKISLGVSNDIRMVKNQYTNPHQFGMQSFYCMKPMRFEKSGLIIISFISQDLKFEMCPSERHRLKNVLEIS